MFFEVQTVAFYRYCILATNFILMQINEINFDTSKYLLLC